MSSEVVSTGSLMTIKILQTFRGKTDSIFVEKRNHQTDTSSLIKEIGATHENTLKSEMIFD